MSVARPARSSLTPDVTIGREVKVDVVRYERDGTREPAVQVMVESGAAVTTFYPSAAALDELAALLTASAAWLRSAER